MDLEKVLDDIEELDEDLRFFLDGFLEGVKWQQERCRAGKHDRQ